MTALGWRLAFTPSLSLFCLVLFGTLACLCRQTQLMCDLFFGQIGVGVTLKDKGARELRKPSAEYTERQQSTGGSSRT